MPAFRLTLIGLEKYVDYLRSNKNHCTSEYEALSDSLQPITTRASVILRLYLNYPINDVTFYIFSKYRILLKYCYHGTTVS